MKTIARGFACLLASSVCVAACANENLPSPHDPASATVNEPSQCGQDSDCKDGQRCVVGSCTSAK